MSDGKVAGSIGKQTPEQQKMAKYKKLSMNADDVMYVADELAFYVHGKHNGLVNVENVVRLQLSDLIAMFAPVFGNVLLPMAVASQQQLEKLAATPASPLVKL